jgi:hypothetical protein
MRTHARDRSIIGGRGRAPGAGPTCSRPCRRRPSSPSRWAVTSTGGWAALMLLSNNENERSRCDGPRPGPCGCLRVLTVRAMLRSGMDPAAVAAITGVPRALVDLILALELDRT